MHSVNLFLMTLIMDRSFRKKISGNENGFYFCYETSIQKRKTGFFDVQKIVRL